MKRCSGVCICFFFVLILFGVQVFAHHGGASYWIMDSRVGPVTGIATKLGFTFPHVSIYLEIADEWGKVEEYMMSIRWTPTVLRKLGWNRKTIKPGDELTVTYIPHKQKATVGALVRLKVNGKAVAIAPPELEKELDVRSEIK